LDAADGGHIPDALIQREDDILDDSLRVIEAYHDPNAGAMTRVGVAPYSPYSVSTDLMRNLAALARDKGVMMHSHLAESDQDVAHCLEKHGCRPSQYVHDLGWTGPDVWHAHCVKFEACDIDLFAQTGTGVAHCPGANCRLGVGIAPIRALRDAGVKVGLGVDGSASNEVSNLATEARQSMLLQRVVGGADKMSPREALELATRGGAQVLGREDVGQIVPGMRADIAIWDISDIETAGSWDPAALLLAGPTQVKHLFVDGRHVINDGWLATLDIARVLTRHSRLSQGLQNA
jgi:cytosine/adenosine deaminase-related metal-dependent hydrolase